MNKSIKAGDCFLSKETPHRLAVVVKVTKYGVWLAMVYLQKGKCTPKGWINHFYLDWKGLANSKKESISLKKIIQRTLAHAEQETERMKKR